MANRSTLAKSKLEEFKKFVVYLGYEIDDSSKHAFQVMRFKIPGYPMAILFNGKSPVHYTANEAAYPFVQKFILTNKVCK